MQTLVMTPSQLAPKPCHTCRRRRLKCDRAVPQCLKCIKNGQACLGYQRLLRWEQGIASRGKMTGMTFEDMQRQQTKEERSSPPSRSPSSSHDHRSPSANDKTLLLLSPTDPLLQDLSYTSRKYLFYFASDVCRDLVLYDTPHHNPFRELIPMTRQHQMLLQIIIANSALRMSNACQRSLITDVALSPASHHRGILSSPTSTASCSSSSAAPTMSESCNDIVAIEAYGDALAAKQKALRLLQSALSNTALTNIDVTLAVVLLFIEFELIDSGRDNWAYHIRGARMIIERLCESDGSVSIPISPLRSCLISNCLVFDILGSTLANSIGLMDSNTVSNGNQSLLQDAEGNHCSSFPAALLHLVRNGTRLSQSIQTSLQSDSLASSERKQAMDLLEAAQAFDPVMWATKIQPHSPVADFSQRVHIASAHRAAVCIYLSRIIMSLDPTCITIKKISKDLEPLVAEVMSHLSSIQQNDPLFSAMAWPVFVAGAETHDPTKQDWVARKFQQLWEVEPWGLIRGALGVLERIWAERKKQYEVQPVNGNDHNDEEKEKRLIKLKRERNWVYDLRAQGVNWLII